MLITSTSKTERIITGKCEGPLQFQTEKFEQEHQIGSGVHNLTIVITDFQILAKY